MKKLSSIFVSLLTFAILFSSENLSAQDKYNKTDKSGRRQGEWVDYHDNGQIRYKGQFKNNEPVGEFLYYSEDGILIAKNNHSKKSQIVESEMFAPNGKLVAKGNYVNKRKQDKWEYYSDEDGSLILSENYENGLLVGKSIVYLTGTQIIIEETEYVNGKKHGQYSKYYDNGKPMIEAYYNNDSLDGHYIQYYPIGTIKEEGEYKNGKKVGEWKTYDLEENVISTDNYLGQDTF